MRIECSCVKTYLVLHTLSEFELLEYGRKHKKIWCGWFDLYKKYVWFTCLKVSEPHVILVYVDMGYTNCNAFTNDFCVLQVRSLQL